VAIDVHLLWELQARTTDSRAVEEDLTRMPQRLAQARGDQAVRENELKAVEAEKQALVLKRRAVEKEVEGLEQKVRDNLGRQGGARTNAELDALKREGAFFREQKSSLETQVLEFFDQEEAADGRIAAAKEKVAQAKQVADSRAKELAEKEAGLKAELERLKGECAALGERLPPPVRSRFDQLARAKGGVAVVIVARGACGGCHNALPPQFVNEVRKAEKLLYCEACGRIIISLDPPTGGDLG
jgi:predicted  nucleic acid-binding Zn-ribbon protein